MTSKSYSVYKLRPWVNVDKLNWTVLSANPNAISLLERNPEKIDWTGLSGNPNAISFTYDYVELKRRMKETIAEDLMKNRFHPRNMDKWVGWGQVEEEDFE
jgi:hypothetical protein